MTYKQDRGPRRADNAKSLLSSASVLCLRLSGKHSAADPVISSGNQAICRPLLLPPEAGTWIRIHVPAPLCSLSRRRGPPRISLPLQRGSSSPPNLTVTDHLARPHYKTMHGKSSHGPRPSHLISKYNPRHPPQNRSFPLT